MVAVVPETLEQILFGISNPQGVDIQKCSQALKKMIRSKDCLAALTVVVSNSQNEAVRQSACVYLRQKVPPFFRKISKQQQSQICAALLEALPKEQSRNVKNGLVDVIATVAQQSVPFNEWKELFPFMISFSSSQNERDVEYALRLFAELFKYIGPEFVNHVDDLTKMFALGLKHQNSSIRQEAMKAFSGLISISDSRTEDNLDGLRPELDRLQEIIPLVIEAVVKSIDAGNLKEIEQAMELFEEFLMEDVSLKDHVSQKLLQFMMFCVKNQNIVLSIRSQAAIILRQFCEFDPQVVLKHKLLPEIVQISIALQFEDYKLPDGSSCDLQADDSADHPESLGGLLLNACAEFFEEHLVAEPAMQAAMALIQDGNEHKRKGGFHVLSVLSDNVQMRMKDHLETLVKATCGGMRDQSPLVRRYSARTMSQLSYELAPEINSLHNLIIPAIFDILDRQGEITPVIQHACSTLEVFCSNMNDEVLPYLDNLMGKLGNVFKTDDGQIRGTALAAISSVAIAAKDAFVPYYESIVTVLVQILSLQDDDKEALRARAMSCVGSIAKGVGRERFQPILDKFLEFAMTNLKTENPALREMTFMFFQDMAEVYQEDLLKMPIFPQLMASLAESLSITATVVFSNHPGNDLPGFSDDEAEEIKEDDDNTIEIESDGDDDDIIIRLKPGDKVDGVQNQYMDEKSTAIITVGVFTKFCGHTFLSQYLKDILEWIENCAGSNAEDEELPPIRKAVAATYDEILQAVHEAAPPGSPNFGRQQQDMVTDIYEYFIDRVEHDDDRENVANVLDYLSESIKRYGETSLVETLAQLEDVILKTFANTITCMDASRTEKTCSTTKGACGGGGCCPPGGEVDVGVHSGIRDAAMDLVLVLAKVLGDAKFGSSLQKFLPPIVEYYRSSESPQIRSAVIGFFSSLLETVPGLCVPLLNDIVNILVASIPHKNAILMQNAAFCLGGVFEYIDKQHSKDHLERTLTALEPLVSGPLPADATQAIKGARDNAISSLCKIVLAFQGAPLPYENLIALILASTPLQEDMAENKYAYDCLFHLWQAHSDKMMPHAARQLAIFAEALADDRVQEDIKTKIAEFVRLLFQSSPVKQQADSLSPAHQQSLHRCFQ